MDTSVETTTVDEPIYMEYLDIFQAAELNNFEGVKYFVEERGTPVNVTDPQGNTAAHYAAIPGNLDIVKYLAERDPSILRIMDNYGDNVFIKATIFGKLNIVRYLVENHKADVMERFKDQNHGNSAIHFAAKHGHVWLLKYFIEYAHGDPNIVNDLGQTPIFLAAENTNRQEVDRYLLGEAKADPTIVDYKGQNFLYTAVDYCNLNLTKYCFDEMIFNIDVNWRSDSGETLLHRAAYYPREIIVKYLLDKQHANLNIVDNSGDTPLHKAAERNNERICRILVEHGADITIKNKEGKLAANKTWIPRLNKYLSGVTHQLVRRSVPKSVGLLESFTPETNKWMQQVSTTSSQAVHHLGGKVIPPAGDVSSSQFQNFLVAADVILRKITEKSNYFRSKHHSLLSPQDILKNRMDPIAIDAITAVPHFSDLHKN